MKNERAICLLGLCASLCAPGPGLAHETPIHQKLTKTAALASSGLSAFLAEQLGSDRAPFLLEPRIVYYPGVTPSVASASGYSPIVWMEKGSLMEDNEINSYPLIGTRAARCFNHFYDPTKVPPGALSDGTSHWPTLDSFFWAWRRDGTWVGTQNHDSWQNARDYQYAALTIGSATSRNQSLAGMLYTLGHVLHLNQDLSQPDHTRNDNHNPGKPNYDRRVWIEPHGLRTFSTRPDWFTTPPASQRGWGLLAHRGFYEARGLLGSRPICRQ